MWKLNELGQVSISKLQTPFDIGWLSLAGILQTCVLKTKVNEDHKYSELTLRNFIVNEQQIKKWMTVNNTKEESEQWQNESWMAVYDEIIIRQL